MALEKIIRDIVPVRVRTEQRTPVEPTAAAGGAGACWGAPSSLDEPEGAARPGSALEDADEHVYINGTEVTREFALVRIYNPQNDQQWQGVEGTRSVTFYTGSREVRGEEAFNGASRDVIETIHTYFRLNFPTQELQGRRGEEDAQATPPHPTLEVYYE